MKFGNWSAVDPNRPLRWYDIPTAILCGWALFWILVTSAVLIVYRLHGIKSWSQLTLQLGFWIFGLVMPFAVFCLVGYGTYIAWLHRRQFTVDRRHRKSLMVRDAFVVHREDLPIGEELTSEWPIVASGRDLEFSTWLPYPFSADKLRPEIINWAQSEDGGGIPLLDPEAAKRAPFN